MNKYEKVVRLHRLVTRNRYGVSKETILRELECSEATFHRVREFLASLLGAPLYFDKKRNSYRYNDLCGSPRLELPGLWFSKDELVALVCLDHAVESLQKGYFAGLFEPLTSRLTPLLAAQKTNMCVLRDKIKIIPIQSRTIDEQIFRAIADAVTRGKKLHITHEKDPGALPVTRIISPQTLIRYRDNWYVDAWCHLRNALRSFAVDKITCARISSEKARRVPGKTLEAFFTESYGIFNGPAKHTAEILFYRQAAAQVCREQWHPNQQGFRLPDGSYRLLIPYNDNRELIMDILKWGEDAKVLAPDELRNAVRSTLKKAVENY